MPNDGSSDEPLKGVGRIVDSFESIPLAEMRSPLLFDRIDSTYVVPVRHLPDLLTETHGDYRVMEVDGVRQGWYSDEYFDTSELRLYHTHHAGRTPRFRVRMRRYETTGHRFLEVIRGERGGRTQSARIPWPDETIDILPRLLAENLLGVGSAIPVSRLEPVLSVDYRRVTLVGKTHTERVSVDVMMECASGEQLRAFPGLAFVEVRQLMRTRSPFVRELSRLRVGRSSISMYCLGLASLHPTVRRNRFQPILDRVERTHSS